MNVGLINRIEKSIEKLDKWEMEYFVRMLTEKILPARRQQEYNVIKKVEIRSAVGQIRPGDLVTEDMIDRSECANESNANEVA